MSLGDIARAEGVSTANVSTELKHYGLPVTLHNATGFPGVKRNRNGTFEARMVTGGKRVTLGTRKTPEEAHALYAAARAAQQPGDMMDVFDDNLVPQGARRARPVIHAGQTVACSARRH